jgi:class 3 adenylate cyclase/tetratricopeptide (TPR) repeat protein
MSPRAGSSVAAVLFTDLVGSTELMARLGDAAFDALRGKHFACLGTVVKSHGGVEVKNTGDGILATFTSAVDALATAVAAQQAVDRQARADEVPVAMRVGLAIGETAFEGDDVFGTPVVEAARLMAAARGGQILCSALLRAMAGSRAEVAFTEVGALELKGLPDPVIACEVAWEPALAESAAVPLPSVVSGAGRIFVGRDHELSGLAQCWKEAGAGKRRLVLLGGEPGVGKTRLATALAQRLHAEGALVLAGRCDEDLGVPYQPFVEALRHYATHTSALRLGSHAGELPRLVPELPLPGLPEPLRSDPETERYRLFDAVAAWLGDVSLETPILLVVDDLQWAAKPTLLLLRHVLRSSEPLRLLVVATFRDTDVGRGHPLAELLADLPRLPGAERLLVRGLDVPAVVTYMEEAAGHGLDEEGIELARAVWRQTEGNGFFVAEVLRHLAESGAITERDGRWVVTAEVADLGIPEGVRAVVGRRLSRLSEEANRVLGTASVVGLEFEPLVVQTAGGFPEDAVFAALEGAVVARLLVEVPGPVPRHRFAHALVRATLYEELSAARRVALHRKVAEAIESLHASDLDDHLPALAHHYARASGRTAETAKAVEYARRAGDRALGQLAHDEAVTYYRQALELLEVADGACDTTPRLDLLIALGEAQRRAGDPDHRESLMSAARLAQERGDGEALARAALANKRGMLGSGVGQVDADRIAVLESALEFSGTEDNTTRARLLAALADEVIYLGDRARRTALIDEAAAIAGRLGDPATLAEVLFFRQSTVMGPETVTERLAGTAEILALAEELHDPALTARALLLRVRAAREIGDFAEADRCLQTAEALSQELGQPTLVWLSHVYRASRTVFAGQLEAGEQAVLAAAKLAEASGQPDAPTWLAVGWFRVCLELDRLDKVAELLRQVVVELPNMPSLRAMLALGHCETDRLDEARTLFSALAADRFSHPVDHRWLMGICDCAAVCAFLSEAAAAEPLHELLAPYAGQVVANAPAISGSVSFYLGLLATTLHRFDEAGSRFAAAEAVHERLGATAWLARTRLEWARMRLTRGEPTDAERARELLDRALASARTFGLANIERRVTQLRGGRDGHVVGRS